MRGTKGYLIITDPDPHKGRGEVAVQEWDTFTCAHCQKVERVKPMAQTFEAPGRCGQCDKLICQRCLNFGCTPFERRLEEYEARERFRREI